MQIIDTGYPCYYSYRMDQLTAYYLLLHCIMTFIMQGLAYDTV